MNLITHIYNLHILVMFCNYVISYRATKMSVEPVVSFIGLEQGDSNFFQKATLTYHGIRGNNTLLIFTHLKTRNWPNYFTLLTIFFEILR
jgi:hypothetical protein